jgi:hypothetical protein
MTALMSAVVRAGAEVVLIQEPSMRKEDHGWISKIRDENYIYIYSGREERPDLLTGIRKDVTWNDYGGIRNSESVGIEICRTRIINIYHYRDQIFNIRGLKEELECSKQ